MIRPSLLAAPLFAPAAAPAVPDAIAAFARK